PQSSILGAVILGDKSRLSEELKRKLNMAGVRHITAISGMHITILSILLMQALIGLGLWKKQAFYLTLAFLILFIVMVGLPASAVRAGLMGGTFLLAKYLGRSSSGFRPIIFAGTTMLAINPLLLKLDVGFQLSFLAVLGIIYLSTIFQNLFKKVPNIFQLRNILAMTFSAQVFTLPILIYNFGYVSIVAPITNILIIPLLPYIMILGFLVGIAGMIWQSLGWIISWPVWLLLTYLTKVIDWSSQIPLATFAIANLHWIWLVAAYLILSGLAWKLNQNKN
ncbi:MAG: ComEC/Rec2 family competence protein, partial [Candidatus Nealsonbacteria bacterium]|nr:ComEC/Rec2 family competence protein [Candidatus Nealsonbacteria bacterium]